MRVAALISEALQPNNGYSPRNPDALLPVRWGEAGPQGDISRATSYQAVDYKIKPCGHSGDLGCWQATENKFSWILRESCHLAVWAAWCWWGWRYHEKSRWHLLGLRGSPGCWGQGTVWEMLQIRGASPKAPSRQAPASLTPCLSSCVTSPRIQLLGQDEVSINFFSPSCMVMNAASGKILFLRHRSYFVFVFAFKQSFSFFLSSLQLAWGHQSASSGASINLIITAPRAVLVFW